ncbi:hypothetical protein ASD71_23640 [Achromobacter sp. Root565]|nr:hypothetical protein ASD71_23640 [Achromobacter sp. Root565]
MFGRALNAGSKVSAALAGRMILMLRIFLSVNLTILALAAVEIYILPDALELFLDHCSFRKNRSNGPVATEEMETELMQRTVKVVH